MRRYRTACRTLERVEEDGTKVWKPKKCFKTLDAAIEICKYLNMKPHRIKKVVAYKCNVCYKYHIGRNGSTITDKVRDNIRYSIRKDRINRVSKMGLKVIGKIDLDKLK